METIQITGLTVVDLQHIVKEAIQQAKSEWELAQKAPSDYEELTLVQAAEELGCCEATIRRKMIQLNIPGPKVGKKIKIQRKYLKSIKKAS